MKTYNFTGPFPQGSATSDYQRFLLGVEFHESALRSEEGRQEIDGATSLPVVPMIASYAFAAELYLKSLASVGTGMGPRTGHKLDLLFRRLSPEIQEDIAQRYKDRTHRKRFELDDDLKAFASAFEEWRYIFEAEGGRQIHVNLLIVFVRSIYSSARATFPTWAVRDEQHSRIMAESKTPTMTVANLGGGVFVHMVDGTGTLNLPDA